MSSILLSPPAIEPWTLSEAKNFLRVAHADDDAVITSLIAAARGQIEAQTRCGLIAQTWRIARDHWPEDGRVALRIGPPRNVVAARVFDAAGNARVVDAGRFVLDKAAGVIAAPPWSLPQPGRAVAGIELDVEIGFGANAASVPQLLRHAVRSLVAHWYDNRGLMAIGGNVAMMPGSVHAMIASYRVLSL
ncbi:MAG: hypothetical protein JWR73_5 [Tardiphaga sp.]|nr:hypothetical protein [Tardiphaga sp.]